MFSSIVLPSITYGLPVYGASEAELTAMQCFLDRCYKLKYTSKSFSIKSKLKGGNMLQAINCRVVAVVGYAAGMVERTNLQIIDRKTHKLMTLHHPCICRLISTGFTLKDQWVVEDL